MTISHFSVRGNQKKASRAVAAQDASKSQKRLVLLERVGIGQVLRSLFVQVGHHLLRRWRNRHGSLENDVSGLHLLFIEHFVGAVVRAHGGTGERDSGEQAARARVGENFGAQCYVGRGFGIASLRSGRRRGIPAKLYFAVQDGARAAWIHDQQNEVGGLSAELEADARALKRHHGRSAPGAGEVFARAADHGAAAVAAADDEFAFYDRGVNDDAFRFVDQVLRDIVGDVHDLFDYQSAILKPLVFFVIGFIVRAERQCHQGHSQKQGQMLFHFISFVKPALQRADWLSSAGAGTPDPDSGGRRQRMPSGGSVPWSMDYTWPSGNFPAGGIRGGRT